MERAPKRRKATKACDNCKRQKTRCEWNAATDESPNGGCHRCRVLSQICKVDGHPSSHDTQHVSTHGPSSTSTSAPPRGDDTPSVTSPTEQEGGISRYQPNFHESTHALESSESFFTDLKEVAWSTPMAMVTRLLAWHEGRPFASDAGKDPASAGIISELETQELLLVFEQKYEPWLGIEAPTPTSPFLVSVRCLIAARHLPQHQRLAVIPPLHLLCREHAMSFILSSTPNMASIQALHILSTWEPIESLTSAGQRTEVQNGGALIAAAIAHALTLRLDAAAEFVHSRSGSKDVPKDVQFKTRMWLSLCTSEFMHCVGAGRFRLSSFREIVGGTLDAADLSTPVSARQLRLGFLAHMVTRLEEAFRALLKSTEDTALNSVFETHDSWFVRFSHLHLITDVEKPCFHALLIQHHGYKVLLLSYAVVRILGSPELDIATCLRRIRETTWGRQLVLTAKTVLTEFVRFGEQPYASSLSHAPDHLFNLVCFAALQLVKTKQMYGTGQPYPLLTLTPLVGRVTEFLKRLALTEDHLSMRCAMLIETLMKACERMQADSTGSVDSNKPEEAETPPRNDDRGRGQPGPSSHPSGFTSTFTPLPTSTGSGGTVMGDTNLAGSGMPEPDSAQGFGFDGLVNLDQMGGIELFFSQPIWPENAFLGQVGQPGGGGVGAFGSADLLGLYDVQSQF